MRQIPTTSLGLSMDIPSLGIGTFGLENTLSNVSNIRHQITSGLKAIEVCTDKSTWDSTDLVSKAVQAIERDKYLLIAKVSLNMPVQESIDKSLDAMKVPYFDIIQVQSSDPFISPKNISEIRRVMSENKALGLGVYTNSLEFLRDFRTQVSAPVLLVESDYSLLNREVENNGLLNACQKQGIPIIAHHLLSSTEIIKISTNRTFLNLVSKYHRPIQQIILNWHLSKSNMMAWVKSTKLNHIEGNLMSMDFEIDKEDQEKIEMFVRVF